MLEKNRPYILLLIIIVIGAFLRFYKLDWAEGLFTHPDEYHIAASVNQLSFPNQMNPNFFSYGTVTIYLIYFTKEIIEYFSSITNHQSLITNSFLIGRFYSALFSTLTILFVYKICRTFMERHFSLLAAFLVALTPGLIQQAHFATPESALIFFLFGSLFFIIKFLKQNKILFLLLASVFLGLALGVKISSIVFLLPVVLSIILSTYLERHSGMSRISNHLIILILTSLIVTIITFALVAPYVFLDFPAFRSNLQYEGSLAAGKIPVFYTRQFIDTIPILFQAEKILPYALGPSLFLFSTVGLIFLAINFIRKPKIEIVILILAFLSLFLPSSFLFAKWTRFIAPTFPFFAIFSAFFLEALAKKTRRSVYYFLASFLLISTIFWTISFFSIYARHDVRITASQWLESHTAKGSTFLVEGGNMIDLPLGGNFQRTSLSFYDLEDDPMTRERIIDALQSSNYFLVQSRRVFYNHQRLRHLYPKTARFYDALFNDELGFKQVKTFHSYPMLKVGNSKLEFPDEYAEETWSVFDHPVIRVFKKNAQLTREEYYKFLEI